MRYPVGVTGASHSEGLYPTDEFSDPRDTCPASPLLAVSIAWMVGIAVGYLLSWHGLVFLSLALLATLAFTFFVLIPQKNIHCPGFSISWRNICWLIALTLLAAGWYQLRQNNVAEDHVRQYVQSEEQLAKVRGTIENQPELRPAQSGSFADFAYQPPATQFILAVNEIQVAGHWLTTQGKLKVVLQEADHRLERGMTIEAMGWLGDFVPPANPGEFDYQNYMRSEGISGRLRLATRGNWQLLSAAPAKSDLAGLRESAAQAALDSLHLGYAPANSNLTGQPPAVALLELILLGHQGPGTGELHEDFRKVGLAHLLAISGAHLGILLGLVWLVTRLIIPNPPRAALVVLIVLLIYLTAVPMRTPIVRAGLMAGLLCVAGITGRRFRPLDLLALAAWLVLIWKPGDLFNAGFQLSFGVVAALIAFTQPVSQRLYQPPDIVAERERWRMSVWRYAVDLFAANLVAYLVAAPIVAYHFQIVSPLTILLALIALPFVTAVLALGYVKIILGLLFPSLGILLATPTEATAEFLLTIAKEAGKLPGSAIELSRPPDLLWLIVTLIVVLAWLTGLTRSLWRVGLAVSICIAWLVMLNQPLHLVQEPANASTHQQQTASIRVNAFSVGDGSCFLVRLPDAQGNTINILFDCGSRQYWNLGNTSITPSLRALGVRRLHMVFLSHADIDHFNGILDVGRQIPIDRIILSPYMLAEARAKPMPEPGRLPTTTQYLIQQLDDQGYRWEVQYAGWEATLGQSHLQLLWPVPDLPEDETPSNDTSLVLKVEVPNASAILFGDVQELAISQLLDKHKQGEINLRAQLCDLPHHGSFVASSTALIDAVQPDVVIQSSGRRQYGKDKWEPYMNQNPQIERWITAEQGLIEAVIADGKVDVASFRLNGPE